LRRLRRQRTCQAPRPKATAKKHGVQATERRARAAATDSGSRTADAARIAAAAAAGAAARGSGNMTAGAADTVVMVDPDPGLDPA
jgi:hypothetical protein